MTFLMISRKLNDDSDLLENNLEKIVDFIKDNTKENEPILIGNILTGNFRNKLTDYGFKFKVQPQAVKSLKNHNNKLIRENDPILFIHVNNSGNVRKFIYYANEQPGKSLNILEINTDIYNQLQ